MRMRLYSIIFALFLTSSSSLFAQTKINGAGASFPYPLYSKWFAEYSKENPKVQFNYSAIGSGGGIRQLIKQTVDFGASDAPMKNKQIKKAKFPVHHIPTILGAVTISYNVKEIPDELKMSGDVIAKIFQGKITNWGHPDIQKLNPDVKLPSKDILRVTRADGSGTTAIFTDYLSSVSTDFKENVGQGKKLRWPGVGIAAKGNDGVTNMIKQTDGAIGYIELAYAVKNKLKMVSVKNPAGEFVQPSTEGVSLAASDVSKIPADFRASIVNSEKKGAYPISAFTYILLKGTSSQANTEIKKFLSWALTKGQKFAKDLHYAPLPKELVKKVLKKLE